jgi:hypothetical protein
VPILEHIQNLREQAVRCIRLAKGSRDAAVAQSLMTLAGDYLERANTLSAEPAAAKELESIS